MSSQTFGLALVGLVTILGLFLFLGWVLMVLVNVVLSQYGLVPLSYGSALAIEALVALFLGGRKASE